MLQVANNFKTEKVGFLVNKSKDWEITNYFVQICNQTHHWYSLCVWAPTVKDIQTYMLYAIDTIFIRNSHKDIVFPIYACDSLNGIIANANSWCGCGSETVQWFIMRFLSRVMPERCRGCNRKGGKLSAFGDRSNQKCSNYGYYKIACFILETAYIKSMRELVGNWKSESV